MLPIVSARQVGHRELVYRVQVNHQMQAKDTPTARQCLDQQTCLPLAGDNVVSERYEAEGHDIFSSLSFQGPMRWAYLYRMWKSRTA